LAIKKMNQETQKKCFELIKKYNNYKSKKHKVLVRNELFGIMQDWMLLWVKSILNKWGKWEEEGELLSISWDAFYFSLESYKEGNPLIPSHFHNYTRYFLLMKYAKEERVHIQLEELKDTLMLVYSPENVAFDKLLTLHQFRDVIPDKYKVIWDDATQSLSSKIMDRKKTYNHGLDDNIYRRIKESYIPIIKLILEII